jgi:hypothetical protein
MSRYTSLHSAACVPTVHEGEPIGLEKLTDARLSVKKMLKYNTHINADLLNRFSIVQNV